jgi:hypothetical protein
MKLAVEREFCRVSEGLPTNQFSIKASAKAFKILSSGLYSDKIKAVIRELSTNAYDSHIANGNATEQFDVHLPTTFESYFSVRDYGTGLSKEELGLVPGVPGIYTTYFDSNKTHSNDYNGCLGLGSKSPFSYVNNFIVESVYGGMKYICSVHLDEYGQPAITLMSESETTERSGLLVQLAVERNDISTFTEKSTQVYLYFAVYPNFTGGKCNRPIKTLVAEGTDWKLHKEYGDSVAIMGNVCYPIKPDSSYFTYEEQQIIDCTFEFTFKMGELEFDAGRESLAYDKKTVACIKKRCADVRKEISVKFADVYKDCKNLYEARVKNVFIQNELSSIVSLIDLPNEFNGEKIFDQYSTGIRIDSTGVGMHTHYVYSYSDKLKTSQDRLINYRDIDKVLFYENDLKIGAKSRCHQYLLANREHRVLLLSFVDQIAKDAFIKTVGFDDSYIKKVSSLPKAAATVRSSNGGPKLEKVCKYRGVYNNSSDCWENTTKDINDGGVYVELNRGKAVMNGSSQHARDVDTIISSLTALGKATEVYGIKTALINKIKGMPQWQSLVEFVKEAITDEGYEATVLSVEDYKNAGWDVRKMLDRFVKLKNDKSKTLIELVEHFTKITKLFNKHENEVNDFQVLYRFVNGRNYSDKKAENKLDKLYNECIIKYPLLNLLTDYSTQEINEHINRYVNQIDKESI